jgi:ABC-2 type transport system permease protein
MELLLAQPLARWRLVLAHFCVDLVTIPVLCLSLWGGTWLGTWLVGPIQVRPPEFKKPPPRPEYVVELGPFKVRLDDPANRLKATQGGAKRGMFDDRLRMEPAEFGRALWLVGALIFAVCGYTMWLSACSRSRWRVLGVSVLLTLLQFLVNLVGQLWDVLEPLRPLTVFYYYQPQQVILGDTWSVRLWSTGGRVPMLAVLLGVGLLGYAMALWHFSRRDLPAPL